MANTEQMTRSGRLYVGFVIACGIIVVAQSVEQSVATLWYAPVSVQWLILAGLTLLSGSFSVKIPTIPARLSVSETFVFAAVLLFGPGPATLVVVLDSLIISLWLRDIPRWPSRMMFNMAAPGVAIWIAAHIFFYLAGIEPLSRRKQEILSLLLPLFALAVCYFLLNSFLIAGAVAFQKGLSAIAVWRRNFLWLSLNYLSGASVAALLLPYLQQTDSEFFQIVGVILPLLLISYLTLKTSLGRVEDANSHLTELNRLYLSTIETLAMAIDAKDQITHGHIRRVQIYAVHLAKSMGVTDNSQIRAIEAAALLHDMGKLAVPEHILNKPGPLTPAEFEKMKLHASVGADILSAIDFPYPVVPIVRHHHENWDGTGYPAGLTGAEIPIGARILSVVDCFDALTSDRPYRPRLSDKDAIRILVERRGHMYDPLIVDTFIKIFPDLTAAVAEKSGPPIQALEGSAGRFQVPTNDRLEEIAASQSETAGLLQLAQELSVPRSPFETAEIILRRIRMVIPTSVAVLYAVDEARQELYSVRALGDQTGLTAELRIAIGQRLSGWVAANKQSIRNSDAMLDLGEAVREIQPQLRSCMAAPVVIGDLCVGVLALYSQNRQAFTDEHQRVLEAIARHAAIPLRSSLSATTSVSPEQRSAEPGPIRDAVLYLRVNSPKAHETNHSDWFSQSLFDFLKNTVRPGDLVLRPSDHELLVILRQVDSRGASVVSNRIAEGLFDYVEKTLHRDPHSIYIAPLHLAAPELSNETVVRLARMRFSSDNQSEQSSDQRIH